MNEGLEQKAMEECAWSPSDLTDWPWYREQLQEHENTAGHLDDMTTWMRESLASLGCGELDDPKELNFYSSTYKVYMKYLIETEKELGDSSKSFKMDELRAILSLFRYGLGAWNFYLEALKEFSPIPYKVLDLLNCVPRILQATLNHCKKSSDLYGSHFDVLLPGLTELNKYIGVTLEEYFSVMDCSVNFNGKDEKEQNTLKRVLKDISDIAVVADGVDLKTLMNTWKIFAKLAVVHEALVKESSSIDVVTNSYALIAKQIQDLLPGPQQKKCSTDYTKALKCAGFLLKILGRLCTLYRGYCGKEVCNVLVQLLANLYRYTPSSSSQVFVDRQHSNFSRYSENPIVLAANELLNILVVETEFPKAFFQNLESELTDTIFYHTWILRIIEGLIEVKTINFSPWLQQDDNIFDLILTNANRCCADLLIGQIRIPPRNNSIFGDVENFGIYEITLKLLCHFVSKVPSDNYASMETTLLKHLFSGEFWSALLSCDLWTYLASISSPEWCYAYVLYFLEVRKLLRSRANSQEFVITSNLVERLYKILPDKMKESIFKKIEDPDDKRFLDPFRKSAQLALTNESYGLEQTFQDVCRSPSAANWTRLISKLKSIGGVTEEGIPDAVTIRDIWMFLAPKMPRSEGIVREMLLELVSLLLDCSALDSGDNSHNDLHAASSYRSMLEILEDLPPQHRLKINVFLRENLVARINDSGRASLEAIADLFCRLIADDDPWVRQEYFETYTEYIVKTASPKLFDALSIGINRLPSVCQQMQLYLSNEKIHNFMKHSSIENYFQKLVVAVGNDPSKWHKCYQSDFSHHEEKRVRLESKNLEERIDDICNEIKYITDRKNQLPDSAMDKLRIACLQFFQTDS